MNLRSLRTYLSSVLPEATLNEVSTDEKHEPLLLMQARHLVVAFAASNGDMQSSYELLYKNFKNNYASQGGKWDALDLAFVFCVDPRAQNLDIFCSNVETDVYFCRKFVVPLSEPLSASLGRLPFLPLTPVQGPSLRTASAQTFLQQCGVPSVLAKYLVVQHERGPERIVEDCLNKEFGEPTVMSPVANDRISHSERVAESVRLESVTIQNFRAYRRPQTFEIGADVTVLYGPNGFGKTSFFDAIDFAATGGIGRLEPSSDSQFTKTAKHLDSMVEEGFVSITFRREGLVRKLTRKVHDRKQALLDGGTTDRKTVLGELTSGNIPATDRVENFVSLFRAMHLFSQEHQELASKFHEDCELSSEIVSRMLAFEDYTNAVSKLGKVRGVLETAISDATYEIVNLSGQILEDKKELARLGQAVQPDTKIDALGSEIEDLRKKLVAVGISVPDQEADKVVVRGWRASLEARQGESQSRSKRLVALASEVAGLPRVHVEIAHVKSQLAEKEGTFATADERRIATEVALQKAEQGLASLKQKIDENQLQANQHGWIRATKGVYVKLREKQHSIGENIKLISEALPLLRTAEEQALAELRTQENRANAAAGELRTKSSELVAVQGLSEALNVWLANRARLAVLVGSNKTETELLESLRTEEREVLLLANQVSEEESRISRFIDDTDRGQSQLKGLVSQLLVH